ncbi:NAD(P)-dependent glycerol-3-phosphate dehydrogenase [Leucobacter rhizosphaerae]|uniref:Glycerol-3-phosphate dehydrogenase [NAD(P)+] n=1 Tax=Leucobacter rhizosphaerae TaxID=2932245 RepID=A0ABY4FWR3_9MICO|nr:NAD(P)H-dependent glycerol-3-phosphate dehydrogenase [Leucobacter rhizosphaerae]UOQ60727.1 NAD(P)-dependent glycerol-3-phosphate dehydrogenase [Leucobacter rhizosphaerae]
MTTRSNPVVTSGSGARNRGRKVAVIGSGSWGTTFAKVLSDAGCDVTMWARRPEVANEIQVARRNSQYLPGINLPKNLKATGDLAVALTGAQLVFLAVPSQTLRQNLLDLEPYLDRRSVLVSLVKGVEKTTTMRMSEVITDTLDIGPERIGVVSGPNIALEIAKEQPTGAVASCVDLHVAQEIATACSAPYFRSYVNTDVIGTELGGVLKNLIALAIGIVDGVGYGENTKAAIITRGLAEMTEFAVASGADPATLSGLAGLGDLIATCQSPLSRNNTAGRLIGQGYSQEETREQMQQTAEGITSVPPVLELARERGIVMPIVEQVQMVLSGTMAPKHLGPHLATEDDVPRPELTLGGAHPSRWQRFLNRMKGHPA